MKHAQLYDEVDVERDTTWIGYTIIIVFALAFLALVELINNVVDYIVLYAALT